LEFLVINILAENRFHRISCYRQ